MHRSGAEPRDHSRRTGLADAALDSAEAALGGVRRTALDLAEDGDVAILLTAGRAELERVNLRGGRPHTRDYQSTRIE